MRSNHCGKEYIMLSTYKEPCFRKSNKEATANFP